MIVAVGLSSLQQCDMSSSRNLFIVGLSLFTGLTVPQWISANQSSIQTGMCFLFVIVAVAVAPAVTLVVL